MEGFKAFLREQGVVGFAVGFILGSAVSDLVGSIVEHLLNPIIGFALGRVDLTDMVQTIVPATANTAAVTIGWGPIVAVFIDFIVVAAFIYWGVTKLGLHKIDAKKDK